MHVGDLVVFAVDYAQGELYRPQGLLWPAGFQSWPDGQAFCKLPGYWRIKYTAGFHTIREGIQEACARCVQGFSSPSSTRS